ncbi:MAG TPA: hypothetical protein VH165_00945 [Kofleriaceae bacterium]|jgi:hypothetical protein|nr:hypothetical protein [Kofleriaceae bacterium]
MISESRRRFSYDFAVYDSRGQLSALVEVKRRFGTTPSWAREWHATMMDRRDKSIDANMVLVAPDRIYVWRPGANRSAPPDSIFEAGPWFAPYFARLRIPVREVDPHVFEQIVGLWLRDVVQGELPASSTAENASALFTGLRGGDVVERVAA